MLHVLKGLIANGTPFLLYYLDLNHFKRINDTFGHNEGDRALAIFCRRIEKHLTANHALARMSGDEFILVHATSLPLDGEEDTRERNFWEQVNREITRPLMSDSGAPFRLSFSIGKAAFPEDGLAISALISQADINMYEQKRTSYAKELKRRYSDGD